MLTAGLAGPGARHTPTTNRVQRPRDPMLMSFSQQKNPDTHLDLHCWRVTSDLTLGFPQPRWGQEASRVLWLSLPGVDARVKGQGHRTVRGSVWNAAVSSLAANQRRPVTWWRRSSRLTRRQIESVLVQQGGAPDSKGEPARPDNEVDI